MNEVSLNGYICKPPIKRSTPLGREIADVLMAVNRDYNKSDYIPLVIWGRNARYAGTLKVGDKIEISGRMQSREYQKQSEDGLLTKIAYEVSVNRISLVDKRQGVEKMNNDIICRGRGQRKDNGAYTGDRKGCPYEGRGKKLDWRVEK